MIRPGAKAFGRGTTATTPAPRPRRATGLVRSGNQKMSSINSFSIPEEYGLKKGREYSDQQLAFLDALCAPENEGNVRRAMDAAGYSRTTRPYVVMSSLRDEIVERTQLMMALHAPKATQKLLSILDDPTSLGAKNLLAATKEILDRAGVIKQERLEIKAGAGADGANNGAMFILPPKLVNPQHDDDDAKDGAAE